MAVAVAGLLRIVGEAATEGELATAVFYMDLHMATVHASGLDDQFLGARWLRQDNRDRLADGAPGGESAAVVSFSAGPVSKSR